MSVHPYVLSAYLYVYSCVLILLLLCSLCSLSLCSCCLYFATVTLIYMLGRGFNLDVNPRPPLLLLRVMNDISCSETFVTSIPIIFHFL